MVTPVRPLIESDIAAYVALRREMLLDAPWAFSSSPETDVKCTPAHLAQSIRTPGFAIIGAFNAVGALVGAAGLVRETHPKLAHRVLLWGMYVTPAARRTGVGHAIVAASIDCVKIWAGVSSLNLCVTERAVGARRLYERHGFTAWGVEPDALRLDGQSIAETHMRRAL